MSTLGKAVILFAADTVGFQGDVGKAVAVFESGMGRMQRIAQSALGWKTSLFSGLSVAGGLAFAKDVIDQAEALAKLSERTGRTVESLSELKLAYELGGGAQEGFNIGLRDFNKSLVDAQNSTTRQSKLFKALGVDINAGPTPALRQFADAFAKLPDDLRASTAAEIFKKGADGWIPVLAKGSAGLDETAQKAKALGLVVSTDFAKQAEQFNDNLKLLEKGSVSLANSILSETLPAFVQFTSEIEKGAERGQKALTLWEQIRATAVMSFGGNSQIPGAAGAGPDLNYNETLVRAMVQGRIASGKIQGALMTPPAGFVGPAEDPERMRARVVAALTAEDLSKRQAHAIEQLEEKKRSLFDLNEQDILQIRLADGSYKGFDETAQKRLKTLAKEIDTRRALIDVFDSELEHAKALDAGRERGNDLFKQFVIEGRDASSQREHELGLIGQTARGQEVLNALHDIDLRLLQARRAAGAAYGEDFAGLQKENARLEAEVMRQREQVIGQIKQRQAVERDWATGARQAFGDYAEAASNSAAAAQMLFSNAFRGAEDALVDFVRHGKLNFASLADSIISDLTRIAVRQAILGPLAQALFGGGGFAGAWASFGGATNNFGQGFGAGADTLGVGAAPYAGGGYTARGGVRLVGEHGPELFVPEVGGNIVSNGELRRMGGGREVNMAVYIQTPDPGSFRASSGQIARDLSAMAQRALR